jgi:hypothetical protein
MSTLAGDQKHHTGEKTHVAEEKPPLVNILYAVERGTRWRKSRWARQWGETSNPECTPDNPKLLPSLVKAREPESLVV